MVLASRVLVIHGGGIMSDMIVTRVDNKTMVRRFDCPKCKAVFENITFPEMNAHRLSHGQLGIEEREFVKAPRTKKQQRHQQKKKSKRAPQPRTGLEAMHRPKERQGDSLAEKFKKALREIDALRQQVAELTSANKRRKERQDFYQSDAWYKVRYERFKLSGRVCACCKATDCELHVDHIRPRSKYPELELDVTNTQVLCKSCNLGKSNADATDWRPETERKKT